MKIKTNFLFILILLIGIALRIYNLGKYNFWWDEILSIEIAKAMTFWNIAYFGYATASPLFYLLLRFWLHLGNSEFILRLLPFIFGVLSIPTIYLVGKELFDKKVGLISAFILAISPFHIYYSQELRTYSLVTFLALITIYYLVRILKKNKIFYWVGFITSTMLILYSHNIALFLMITVNCYFLLFYKKYKILWRNWLISQFIILLLYLPWVKIIFVQIWYAKALGCFQGIPTDYLTNFIQIFRIFNLGYNAKEITHLLIILLFLPLFLFGIWDEEKKEEIYLLLCWLFIPIIMLTIFSNLMFPLYLVRVLIYISPAYYIIIAYGVSRLKLNKIYLYFFLFFSILVGFSLKNHYLNIFPLPELPYRVGVHPRKEFKLASDYINQNYQKGDIIGHTSEATHLPFLYYHKKKLEETIFVSGHQNLDINHLKLHLFYFKILKEKKILPININIPVNIETIKRNSYKRIWLVFSSWENNQTDLALENIKKYLEKNFIIVKTKEFLGITIYLYQI